MFPAAPGRLDLISFDLTLHDSVKHGSGPLRNLDKECAATWRRTIRARGGYWLGTCQFDSNPADQMSMFLDGLGREVRETVGNALTWQGFIAEMALTVGGQTYVRKWLDLANRVQAIYTKLGDNLLTNGSAESGAWNTNTMGTLVAPPSQSTAWVSDGTYSCYIDNSGGIANGGTYIPSLVGIGPIVAGKSYDCTLVANVVAGPWTLVIQQHLAGLNGAGVPVSILGQGSENNTGQRTLRANIPNTNTYAGLVDICIYNSDGTGKAYFDAGNFRETPLQARTSWYADSLSALEYGTLEAALLQGSMADQTANAHAATALAESKWPRTVPPADFGSGLLDMQPDGLTLTVAGYVWSLRNKYAASSRVGTTQNASVHVTNLISDAEFVTAGNIQANTFQYQIDDRAPLRAWEVLRAITLAGDASGNRWTCGVYGGRLFNYQQASTALDYHFRAGQLVTISNDAVMPWLVQPGNVYLDDMPVGAGSLTSNTADDPHVLKVEEVEFDAGAYLAGGSGLNLHHLADSDDAGGA